MLGEIGLESIRKIRLALASRLGKLDRVKLDHEKCLVSRVACRVPTPTILGESNPEIK
jgi:hypothetical protein